LIDFEDIRHKKCAKNLVIGLFLRLSLAAAGHAQKGTNLEIQTTGKLVKKGEREHKFGIGKIYVRFACTFSGL